jgi:hypothetical protein
MAGLADLAAVGVGRGQADYVLPLLACSDARLRDGPGVRRASRQEGAFSMPAAFAGESGHLSRRRPGCFTPAVAGMAYPHQVRPSPGRVP